MMDSPLKKKGLRADSRETDVSNARNWISLSNCGLDRNCNVLTRRDDAADSVTARQQDSATINHSG